eukprot:TRINITY_DN853_c0_g1_i4.p1 TRINITY_DN853_c0_g1~~TRINITY_DN853_c0_g1_i4.p1  ORF type:complete len:1029 (+),score=293.33 TRINITY_DN853_c0_g1_i4:17-3103(+)
MSLKKPITEGEQTTISTLCNELINYQGVIDYCRKGALKTEERIFALGRYRFFLLRRGKSGKLMRDHHLYQIEELQMLESENKMVIRTKTDDPKQTLTFELITDGLNSLKSILQAIRLAYTKISKGFPEVGKMKLNVAQAYMNPGQHPNESDCGGFVEIYKAFCDFCRVPASAQVVNYVHDKLVHFKRNVAAKDWKDDSCFELHLNEIVGALGDPSTYPELAFSLTPFFAALQHNYFFRTLKVRNNVNRKDVLQLLSDCLKSNACLTRLDIESDTSGGSIVGIGEALRNNKASAVQAILLRNNPSSLAERGVVSLSKGLEELPRALTRLDLSGSGVTDRALLSLIYSFEKNYGMSLALEHLNLSRNYFDDAGTTSLANWLLAMGSNSNLITLKLSYCGNPNLQLLTRGVRGLPKITKWDLSGNRVDQNVMPLLTQLLENSQSLTNINLTATCLNNENIFTLLTAFFSNKKTISHKIGLGKNNLNYYNSSNRKFNYEFIPRALTERVNRLEKLDLSDNQLKQGHLLGILLALYGHPYLKSLSLSNSFAEAIKGQDKIASAISTLVWSTPTLQDLNLNGGFTLQLIELFVQGISNNGSLKRLDLSNNKLGDAAATFLTAFIRSNRALKVLRLENVGLSLLAWQTLAGALKTNKSLTSFHDSFPWSDYDLISKQLGSDALSLDLLRTIMRSITTSLHDNDYLLKASISVVAAAAPPTSTTATNGTGATPNATASTLNGTVTPPAPPSQGPKRKVVTTAQKTAAGTAGSSGAPAKKKVIKKVISSATAAALRNSASALSTSSTTKATVTTGPTSVATPGTETSGSTSTLSTVGEESLNSQASKLSPVPMAPSSAPAPLLVALAPEEEPETPQQTEEPVLPTEAGTETSLADLEFPQVFSEKESALTTKVEENSEEFTSISLDDLETQVPPRIVPAASVPAHLLEKSKQLQPQELGLTEDIPLVDDSSDSSSVFPAEFPPIENLLDRSLDRSLDISSDEESKSDDEEENAKEEVEAAQPKLAFSDDESFGFPNE